MSIEYQLYSMSLTNHIIIPIVGSKQNLDDQNIFVSSYFNLTPQKQQEMPDLSFWKKSMSAFKKFKQKKDKKDKKQSQDFQQNQNNYLQLKRDFSKLVKRKSKENNIYAQLKYEEYLETYKYFDPNDAPLYELQIETNFQYKLKGIKSVTKPQKIDQEIQQIKMVKLQSQINEQELPVQQIVQSRFDDPFIIIRKDNIKKTNKSIKSKPIKKDKHFKNYEDRHQSIIFNAISIKEKPSPSGNLIKKEDSSQRISPNSINNHQSTMIKINKFEESDNSSQENLSNEQPVKLRKQMHTLKQIVKEANEKNSLQSNRSVKQREKLFGHQKNDENCELGCIQ